MSLGVLNNISAIYAENNLSQTQASLQSTLTQLSSGSRINSGSDDAAGLSVAVGLQANQSALKQSAANATSGIGLLQTADGALSQVNNLLNRAVTLATEAANGTFSSSQVSSANQEYQNILTEIGNIGTSTNYNNVAVFSSTAKNIVVSDGTSSGTTTFSEVVGSLSASSVGESAAASASSASVSLTTPSASTSTAGSATTLTLGGTNHTVSGTLSLAVGSGSTHAITVASGTTLSQLATAINGDSTYSGEGISAAYSSSTGVLTISGPADSSSSNNGHSTLAVTGTSLSDTTPAGSGPGAGVDFSASSIATLTNASAQSVLTSLTSAIGDVAYQRGIIGANVNELTAASNVATSESENLQSAQNSITATDYGVATSNLAKYQVLSQTGISALAQANSVQQEVLKLLQ